MGDGVVSLRVALAVGPRGRGWHLHPAARRGDRTGGPDPPAAPGPPGNRLTMVLLSVIALGAAWFEGSRIQSNIDAVTSSYVVATLGAGIYVIGGGGVLVLLVSLFGGASPNPQPSMTTHPD